MTPESAVMDDKLRSVQWEVSVAANANRKTGTTGVPTKIDDFPVVEFDDEINREEELDIKVEVENEGSTQNDET